MFDIHRLPRGYQLRWPRSLFRDELTDVLDKAPFSETAAQLKLLFEEAFVGEEPAVDVPPPAFDGPDNEAFRHGKRVLAQVDKLPLYEPRVYYQDRHKSRQVLPSDTRSPEAQRVEVQNSIRAAIRDLDGAGYFDQATGGECAGSDNLPGYHASVLRQKIARGAGIDVAWPLRELAGIDDEQLLADDAFFTLIEVLHDLVARPRSRWWHDYDEHFNYGSFDQLSGEAIYRWRINDLLKAHRLGFRVADQGLDKGQVVTTALDPRADLEERAADHVDTPNNRDLVEHAVSLFRRRGATVEEKRSACRALAGVLEHRRSLIKEHLKKKDEGALFQIANEFWIRHHDGGQHTDYAQDEFLDWIFWNYLSAVELTNRLLARDATSGGGDA